MAAKILHKSHMRGVFICMYTLPVGMHAGVHTCLARSPKKCTQSGNFQLQNIPVHLKILSSRKLTHGNACEGILKLELSRRIQFKLLSVTPSIYVIYDTLWSVRSRIFLVQTGIVIWNVFASHQQFLCFCLGKQRVKVSLANMHAQPWWTNQTSMARQ